VQWAASTAAGTLVLVVARLAVLGTLGGDRLNPAFRVITDGERIRVALAMIPRAAAMLILPMHPAIDYVPTLEQLRHPSLWMVALGLAIVVAVMIAIVHHLRRPSALGLGACVTGAAFLPTSNLLFPSGVVLTGRTLYAPAIGAAFIIAAATARLRITRLASPVTAVVATVLVFAAGLTWQESAVWKSSESVFAEMQRRHPEDYRSFYFFAYTARDAGRDTAAVSYFRAAAERFPAEPEMLIDGATVALRLHDTVTARAWLEHAVAVNPGAARGRTRLVHVRLAQGDSAGARQLLVDGLREEPGQRAWIEELQILDSVGGKVDVR
jgi:hypothetical protein